MADIIQAAKWLAEKRPVRGPDTNGGRETYRDLYDLAREIGSCSFEDGILDLFVREWVLREPQGAE